MKKYVLSVLLIGAFGSYALYARSDNSLINSLGTSSPVATEPVTLPTTSTTRTLYKNGTYIGKVADAYYGNLQVQAVVENGVLADVRFLQYPSDRRTSEQINERAMPQLRQEALTIQHADVDVVSGATDSSMAFKDSLADALIQASISQS